MPAIQDNEMVLHFLNVGHGDTIIVEFPADAAGIREFGIVDCRDADKTIKYLDALVPSPADRRRLKFVCATHPHYDHISGINEILQHATYKPEEFWDSGFWHRSETYHDILQTIADDPDIEMVRVSSGMEWYFSRIRVTALAPSIMLRNRYDTYGVDMNNASIVLRLEHHADDVVLIRSEEYEGDESRDIRRRAGQKVVILTGDAEFDSWAQVAEEFPKLDRSVKPLVKKMVNQLSCSVIKVAHHGSMHSTPLDMYEKMDPELAIISARQDSGTCHTPDYEYPRDYFPHRTTVLALEESEAKIVSTEGQVEGGQHSPGNIRDAANAHEGSIIVVVPPAGRPRFSKLDDARGDPVPVVRDIG